MDMTQEHRLPTEEIFKTVLEWKLRRPTKDTLYSTLDKEKTKG
jgi:hypothetical protein